MKETAHIFGRHNGLVGVVSRGAQDDTLRPCVIVQNSGLLPRTGSFRLSVLLSRGVSALSFCVLRFDLSGIGDSKRHLDNRSFGERHQGDVNDAMDFMSATFGYSSFILVGVCAGADLSHKVSVTDNRVVGAIFIDGYSYPTIRYYLKHYGGKLFSPAAVWINRGRRITASWTGEQDEDEDDDPRKIGYYFVNPPRRKTRSEIEAMVSRGMQLKFIYTESNDEVLYSEQLLESLQLTHLAGDIKVNRLENTTHSSHFHKGRSILLKNIFDWFLLKFSGEKICGDQA